jgi:hypothetical protein
VLRAPLIPGTREKNTSNDVAGLVIKEKDRKTRGWRTETNFVGSSTLLVSWRRREAVVCFVSREGSRATGGFGVLETQSRIMNV